MIKSDGVHCFELRASLILAIGCLLTSAIAFCPAVIAQQKICDGSDLPAPIQTLLKNKFPLMRPKQLMDMTVNGQQFWLKTHEKECPGIVIGDFESKDQLAYAVMLVSKAEPTGAYKLMVFSKGTKGDSYVSKQLNEVEGPVTYIDSSGLVISKAPPGKYSDFLNTRSIQLSLDGIFLEWTTGSTDLFYFSAGKYLKLSVSE
ncbi:MAG TPA: hypothetical protein VLV89_05770 [Candidatus Acidoferrum sp.]|nr:hypothetical protein [Candidatus Acidoferrum sp.]